jgi:hypothetical protein
MKVDAVRRTCARDGTSEKQMTERDQPVGWATSTHSGEGDNLKTSFKESGCQDVSRIQLAADRM